MVREIIVWIQMSHEEVKRQIKIHGDDVEYFVFSTSEGVKSAEYVEDRLGDFNWFSNYHDRYLNDVTFFSPMPKGPFWGLKNENKS